MKRRRALQGLDASLVVFLVRTGIRRLEANQGSSRGGSALKTKPERAAEMLRALRWALDAARRRYPRNPRRAEGWAVGQVASKFRADRRTVRRLQRGSTIS